MEFKCPSCEEDILISDDDTSSTFECPFCQQRISISNPEPTQPPPVINQKREPSIIGGEKTFYQDQSVIVTDKRVVLAGKTYALKQITSVGMAVDRLGPKLIFGKSAWMVFLVSLIISILIFMGSGFLSINFAKFNTAENQSVLLGVMSAIGILVSLILPMIFLIWALAVNGQPRYWVEIGSASGKEKALLCNSSEQAQSISDAVNNAIIEN